MTTALKSADNEKKGIFCEEALKVWEEQQKIYEDVHKYMNIKKFFEEQRNLKRKNRNEEE